MPTNTIEQLEQLQNKLTQSRSKEFDKKREEKLKAVEKAFLAFRNAVEEYNAIDDDQSNDAEALTTAINVLNT